MASLFISYSRKDKESARKLTEAFQGQDLDFWIDWEGIPPTVDWWKEIEKGIEEADIFLFLLSPNSASSNVCRRELEHAIRNGKRLVPVVVRDIQSNESPDALSSLNWIFLREADDFEAAFDKLMTAIRTDYGWVQSHRRLQVRALEWGKKVERSLLLRGKDLREAEEQLASAGQKDPLPTDLQRRYVLESRRSESRTRNAVLIVGALVIVTLAFLSVVAFNQSRLATANAALAVVNLENAQTAQANAEAQRALAVTNEQEALRQAKISRGRALAANSQLNRDKNQLSLLLAMEAFDVVADLPYTERLQPEQALRDSLSRVAGIPINEYEFNNYSLSPDGRWLAVSWLNSRISLVDMENLHAEPVVLREEGADITNSAFSADGRWLAIGSKDRVVRVWDMQNPSAEPSILAGHQDQSVQLAFSPDGNWLASWGWTDDHVNVWDLHDLGLGPSTLPGHPDNFSDAFSPDARWLVTVDKNQTARVWDLQSRSEEPVVLSGYGNSISYLTFSPNGHWLVAASAGTAPLWDMQNLSAAPIILQGAAYDIPVFTFSPDGRWLIADQDDFAAQSDPHLWDLQTLATDPIVLDGLDAPLLFTPDSHFLVITEGATIQMLDLHDRSAAPLILRGHEQAITTLALSPNGRWLAAGSLDQSIRLWDVEKAPALSFPTSIALRGHEGTVFGIQSIGFSSNGHWLISSSGDGIPRLWDMQNILNLSADPKIVQFGRVFAFSADSQWVASEGPGHTISLAKIHEPAVPAIVLPGFKEEIESVMFSPNGRWLAADGGNSFILLWDLKETDPEPSIAGIHGTKELRSFTPDSRLLITSADTTIQLWDVNNLETPVKSITLAGPISDVVLSPDSLWLAINDNQNTVQLLNLQNPDAEPILLRGHQEHITALDFSPDSHWLASGSFDGESRVWDLQNLKSEPEVLRGHTGYVYTLVFSPDSQQLATGSFDQTIRLWDVPNRGVNPTVLVGYVGSGSPDPTLAFSSDGGWLATAGGGVGDQPARLWNLRNLSIEPILLIGPEDLADISSGGVAFSPDGRWLATWHGRVRLWDMQNLTAEPILLQGNGVSFSPDGSWFVTGGNHTKLVWNLNVREIREEACEVVGRNFSREEWMQYFPDEEYRKTCEQWRLEPVTTPTPVPVP